MGSFSDEIENQVLDQVFGASDYAEPATQYIGLSKADPGDDASGLDEPSGGSYARVAVDNDKVTWSAAAAGALANAILIQFPQATGDWGTITHFCVWDHLTAVLAVNLIGHSSLSVAKAIDTGDTAKFAIGELDVTLD